MEKITNNFDTIGNWLTFNDEDFYFIQIMKRRKDIPDLSSNSIDIATYYVKSLKGLEKLKPDIIEICNALHARAYISTYSANPEKAALNTIAKITQHLISGETMASCRAWESSCANSISTVFLIDVDTKDEDLVARLEYNIYDITKNPRTVVLKLETPNGFHLITEKFNRTAINKELIELGFFEIKSRASTLLYFKQNN